MRRCGAAVQKKKNGKVHVEIRKRSGRRGNQNLTEKKKSTSSPGKKRKNKNGRDGRKLSIEEAELILRERRIGSFKKKKQEGKEVTKKERTTEVLHGKEKGTLRGKTPRTQKVPMWKRSFGGPGELVKGGIKGKRVQGSRGKAPLSSTQNK